MGGAAVLLAGKVEERARKCKDVALAFLTMQHGAAAADASSEVRGTWDGSVGRSHSIGRTQERNQTYNICITQGFAERVAAARQKLTEAERALLNGASDPLFLNFLVNAVPAPKLPTQTMMNNRAELRPERGAALRRLAGPKGPRRRCVIIYIYFFL